MQSKPGRLFFKVLQTRPKKKLLRVEAYSLQGLQLRVLQGIGVEGFMLQEAPPPPQIMGFGVSALLAGSRVQPEPCRARLRQVSQVPDCSRTLNPKP